MTIHHQPRPPTVLRVLESLELRMDLPSHDRLHYQNLKKGYLGELKFARLLEENLLNPRIVNYDLSLKTSNTEFQIDCLLIFNSEVYLLEIKNYEGDFCYHNDNWYIVDTKKEIRSPLMQLKRSELLLQEQLQKLGYKIPIKSHVIFINSAFTLYQAPVNPSIILPTQIERFFKKISNLSKAVNRHQTKLANQLTDLQLSKSKYKQIPEYDYDGLKKGFFCRQCSGMMSLSSNTNIQCSICERKEKTRAAVLHNVIEYNLLFPDKTITTSSIYDWCGEVASKKVIRKALQEYLQPAGNGRSTHYNIPASMSVTTSG